MLLCRQIDQLISAFDEFVPFGNQTRFKLVTARLQNRRKLTVLPCSRVIDDRRLRMHFAEIDRRISLIPESDARYWLSGLNVDGLKRYFRPTTDRIADLDRHRRSFDGNAAAERGVRCSRGRFDDQQVFGRWQRKRGDSIGAGDTARAGPLIARACSLHGLHADSHSLSRLSCIGLDNLNADDLRPFESKIQFALVADVKPVAGILSFRRDQREFLRQILESIIGKGQHRCVARKTFEFEFAILVSPCCAESFRDQLHAHRQRGIRAFDVQQPEVRHAGSMSDCVTACIDETDLEAGSRQGRARVVDHHSVKPYLRFELQIERQGLVFVQRSRRFFPGKILRTRPGPVMASPRPREAVSFGHRHNAEASLRGLRDRHRLQMNDRQANVDCVRAILVRFSAAVDGIDTVACAVGPVESDREPTGVANNNIRVRYRFVVLIPSCPGDRQRGEIDEVARVIGTVWLGSLFSMRERNDDQPGDRRHDDVCESSGSRALSVIVATTNRTQCRHHAVHAH